MANRLIPESCVNLIDFIPQSGSSALSSKSKKNRTNDVQTGKYELDRQGKDIKSFYEDVVSEKTSKISSSKISSKRKHTTTTKPCFKKKAKPKVQGHHQSSSSSPPSEKDIFHYDSFNPRQRQHLRLLKCSQIGDESAVDELLSQENVNVDFKDFYGWTALMCAAKEGHLSVTKLLLRHGADRSIVNSSGDTAFSLATDAGHSEVAIFIRNCNTGSEDDLSDNQDFTKEREVFHCDTCKQDFSQEEATSHQTSTVHLFNSGFLSKSPAYFLPESNRGFQMMLRSGWNSGRGLGPDGKGSIYPVKTVFKVDRIGLGSEHAKGNKARVTHFGKGDQEAVQSHKEIPLRQLSVRKAARQAAKFKEKKSRHWEKNLRFEMS